SPPSDHRAFERNQRRMGNRKNLPQHGMPKPTLSLRLNEFTEKKLRRRLADCGGHQGRKHQPVSAQAD
ncbi:MAG TPA: hypothetical protein VFW05_15725, partial [Verrucomicrobiae bacterium]|nr:hypothetical protein [Verrucomicrobiae bacterium]